MGFDDIAWRPGIGDPSALGWFTVVAYFGAVALCTYAFSRARRSGAPSGLRAAWLALAFLMGALGMNKQLDVQSLFTELGRICARQQGWYEHRREMQAAFIGGMVLFGFAAFSAAAILLRRHARQLAVAGCGAVFLVVFVVVRAASFHHVDLFLASRLGGILKMNWVLELGGIFLVSLGAWLYARTL